MSGVDELIFTEQYVIVIAVTVFFSLISLVTFLMRDKANRSAFIVRVISTLLAGLGWFISGAVHVGSSPSTSPLFAVSYLWYGFGVIFLLVLLIDYLLSWRVKREQEWDEV